MHKALCYICTSYNAFQYIRINASTNAKPVPYRQESKGFYRVMEDSSKCASEPDGNLVCYGSKLNRYNGELHDLEKLN